MILTTFLTLFIAAGALAAPSKKDCSGCDTSNAQVEVPAGKIWNPAPVGNPSFVTLGIGIQNYTCKNGSYASVGAVAKLYDLSCLSQDNPQAYSTIQDVVWSNKTNSCSDGAKSIPHKLPKLGDHYFIANATGALSPVWDFRADSAQGQADAFVLASKVSNFPAPNTATDVDWLELRKVNGSLASLIFRTETRGGQPPSSCSADKPAIQVPYVSLYHLYGSNITLSKRSKRHH